MRHCSQVMFAGRRSDFDAIGPRLKKGLGRRGVAAAPMCVRNCEESPTNRSSLSGSRLARSVGRCVPASHGRGWQGARNASSLHDSLTRTRFLGGRAHTHIRTRHARAPIVMIESDKIAGLTTQQPENSTQDCLDCRLSDMLNTSSSVRYAPIPNIYFLSFPVVM